MVLGSGMFNANSGYDVTIFMQIVAMTSRFADVDLQIYKKSR